MASTIPRDRPVRSRRAPPVQSPDEVPEEMPEEYPAEEPLEFSEPAESDQNTETPDSL